MNPQQRITRDPAVMSGQLRIRGMCVTFGAILARIAAGRSIGDVLADRPYLEREDILQLLQHGASPCPSLPAAGGR